jgi:hypothetical protein
MLSKVSGYAAARDTVSGISCEQLRGPICQPQNAGLLLVISGCQFGGNGSQVAEQTC